MSRLVPVAALVVALGMVREGSALAAPGRYAVVIGDNEGDRDEVELRYAELDARRVAELLRAVGGFFPENVAVLTGVGGDDVRRALITLNARLRQSSAGTMLFVFYSGHADATALHLRGTSLGLTELRDLVAGSPADARVLVVDSCRSGTLTRVKGGRPGPSFDIQTDGSALPKGLAILTSSAAGEDAQESDQLNGSIFTHHLVSALMGAADRNGDGRVTIDEAFAYASERTLSSTAVTFAGPQHPTYRLELGGRDDLTLTWPGDSRDRGVLTFVAAGTYFVQRGGRDGPVVAEITTDRDGGRLVVEPGRYFVWQRRSDSLREDIFAVRPGAPTTVDDARMRRVEYARVVRKGTAERRQAWSAIAVSGFRGEMLGLGGAWWSGAGARLDLPHLSVEAIAAFGASATRNERLTIATYETAFSAAGLHVFDVGRLSLGVGLAGGFAWFAQRFSDPGSSGRDVPAGFFGPIAQGEVPLTRQFYACAEIGYLTYVLKADPSAGVGALPTYRAIGGLGAYF
jgi:hypothetical protein